MTGVETRWVDLVTVASEWDRLADRLAAPPFARAGWMEAWHQAFGTVPLRVLAAFDGGRLVGVLPLQERRGWQFSPTNWETPQYVVLADSEQARAALLSEAILSCGWRLQLAFLDVETAHVVEETAARLGREVLTYKMQRSPFVALEGTFEDYYAALSKNLRKPLGRRRRNLALLGEVALEVHSDYDEEALTAFFLVEGSGWKGEQGTSITQDPRSEVFYRAVARWAAREGLLRIALLRVGDRVVAGDLSLESATAHYVLKTGYDVEFADYSPGKLLRYEMISRAFRERLEAYEFLGADGDVGAGAWKKQWTTSVHPWMRVLVFGPGIRGQVLRSADVHGRPVAKAVVRRVGEWRARSSSRPAT